MKIIKDKWGLDFDDAYQFAVARKFGLRIITQDADFKRVQADIKVLFV